ncbi:MAG: AzlD domain-containing protein [Micrococcales bacterium]|nr:AzlD domain-containing protein [Micrococcales bacterium]
MSLWTVVLLSALLGFVLKFAGYLVPAHWLEGPRMSRVTTLLPVALLSALIITQAFTGDGGALVLDARAAAVAVTVVLLLLRANFIVVVLLAAAVAAGLRAMGSG